MSVIIRRLIDRFYPKDDLGYTVTLLGLDYVGKTTLLYRLKLNEVVTTISTIGFNIETVKAPTMQGKPLTMTCWDIGMGCGIRYLFGLIRLYTERADAVIWVVDSCDRERIPESLDSFKRVLAGIEDGNPKAIPILILANKQDRPGAIPLDELRKTFAGTSSRHSVAVFKSSATDDIATGGLPTAFYWLREALESPSLTGPQQLLAQPMPDLRSPDVLVNKLESWLTRAENECSPDEFLTQFRAINLPTWDHYTHIRIAFVTLAMHGRQKGKNMIFDGIERYITESAQTKGRTFHVTMTYFWIQLVHFGMRSMAPSKSTTPSGFGDSTATLVEPKYKRDDISKELDLGGSTTTLANPESTVDSPSPEDFARFLLLNPYVADGNLWADYYSKEVMMSPGAKAGMVLPDKKPLPNLVVRDAITVPPGTHS